MSKAMNIFEKLAAKGKKHKVQEIAENTAIATTAVGSTAAVGLGATRKYFQSKADPRLIDIKGGATPNAAGSVFNFQRDAWADALRKEDFKVNTHSNYDTRYQTFEGVLPNSDAPKSRGAVEMHVGSSPHNQGRVKLKRILTGQPSYRVMTDFGPGNFDQPPVLFGGKNWMRAEKGDAYTRNIVPGGDSFDKVPSAYKSNINVKSMPVGQAMLDEAAKITPTVSKKKRIAVMGGSGVGWHQFMPGYDKHMDSLVTGLKQNYGDDFELTVLGGPNNMTHKEVFEASAKAHPNHVKHIASTDREGVARLMKDSDIVFMAPGSTAAEYAAMEGKKPKMISMIPEHGPHFKSNADWLEKNVGGHAAISTQDMLDPKKVKEVFAKSDSLVAPTEKAIKFGREDARAVLDVVQHDIKKAKGLTNKLLFGGIAGLGALGAYKMHNSPHPMEKKAAKKHKDSDSTTLGTELAVGGMVANSGVHKLRSTLMNGRTDFANFDAVKNHYKDIKKGDMIFFNSPGTGTELHPIIVTDPSHFDYPDGENWDRFGARKVDPIAPKDLNRPYRLKGKFIEFGPGGLNEGAVEGRMWDAAHSTKKVDGGGLKPIFSPEGTRQIGHVYRPRELDEAKFDRAVEKVKKNRSQFGYGLQREKFNVCGKKTKGTCVNFAQALYEEAGVNVGKKNIHVPAMLGENFEKVIDSRTRSAGRLSVLTPVLGGIGAAKMYHGIKNKDNTDTAIGAGLVAASAAPSALKMVRQGSNAATGIGSEVLGNTLIQLAAGGVNLIAKKMKKGPVFNMQTMERYLESHRTPGRAVATAAVGTPLIYGTSALLNTNKKNEN